MENKTVKIAGAGISGLTASIVLAKSGYKVKIFERNDIIGKRFNEDFQGLMNWGFKEDVLDWMQKIGLDRNFYNRPVYDIDVYGPDKYKNNFSMEKPFCYLVCRGIGEETFDQALKKQAIDNGVEIIFNSPKKENDVDILATGPVFDGITDVMAAGYSFETNSEDKFGVILDDDLAYNGYSYFFVVDGHGTIATCIFDNYDKLSDYLEKTYLFIKKKYSFNIKNKRKFTGVGNFYLLDNNKKYVGEAGGFQDFLWGFGMRYAMITGYLAAKSIIERKNYENLWKKELGGLLKTSIVNRLWFSLLGKNTYKYLIKLLKKENNPIKSFTRIYKPNFVSRILYPFAKIYFRKFIKNRTDKNFTLTDKK